jgi:hypothetical protein
MPFTWLKTSAPTVTLIGTVTLLEADWNRSWPVKVPATRAAPGRFAGMMPTVTEEGVVPLVADTFSQPPPSEVVALKVQFNVPEVSPFRRSTICAGGADPDVFMEKLIWPGTLSKNGVDGGTTVK